MKPVDLPFAALTTARGLLLTPHGIDETHIQRALADVFQHRVDYADAYFQYTRFESWSLEEGIVKSGSFGIDQGVGLRAVAGERQAFSYSDQISEQALKEAARTTRSIARQGAGRARVSPLSEGHLAHQLYSHDDPLDSLDSKAKITMLERLETIARQLDTRVTQVMASLSGEYDVILVARSDGAMVADVRPLVRIGLTVIAEENGRREQGSSGTGGRSGYERFDDTQLTLIAKQAVDQALINLSSRPAPAGPTTVVLGPGWPAVLLHEAIGHGLEGDFNRKGSSAFTGMIGERVAAPGITIVDDGTLPGRRGSLNVDDEGNATRRTVLIEDGILRGYMQDTLNARLTKSAVTGNGRRESYAHLPMPRMTNTVMENGHDDPAEIIASVKDGLYAVNFGGGQVDITNGKFTFSTTEAYRIENGRVTYPVKGATLIGNGPDALTRVKRIGNDMELDQGIGTCGKDGQSVPVGMGQPTLLIENLTVGGTGA
jgi:TldD protein